MNNFSSFLNSSVDSASISNLNSKTAITEKYLLNTDFNYDYSSGIDSFYGKQVYGASSATNGTELVRAARLKTEAERRSVYLVSLTSKDEFIEGETSTTEIYLTSLYKEDPALFSECFQKTWLKLYELADTEILANFISIISAIEYDWLQDKADTLILGGCCHIDPYVNEATLRAVEAWESPKHSNYLSNIRAFEIPWLEEYRQTVIEFIEGIR